VRFRYRDDDERWRARELDFRDTLRSFAALFRVDPGARAGQFRIAVHCAAP